MTREDLSNAINSFERSGHRPSAMLVSQEVYYDMARWGHESIFHHGRNDLVVFGIRIRVSPDIANNHFIFFSEDGIPYAFVTSDLTFQRWSRDSYSGATQEEILSSGVFGHLFTADIHVSSTMSPATVQPIEESILKLPEYSIHDVECGFRWELM